MLPFVSLSAANSTGPGAVRDFEGAVRDITMVVSTTGAPSSCSVALEGSHDQTSWFSVRNGTGTSTPTAFSNLGTDWFRYARANLTALSGGSSPTVTATILADVADEE